ncbi:MAG: AMP-binding protein, partial [Bauldia sp.]
MNLYARLAYLAENRAGVVAVETASERLTYDQFQASASRIARRLRAAGVGRGDIVGLHLRDAPIHLAAFFAVMRLGATILPLDWRSPPSELSRVIDRFGP